MVRGWSKEDSKTAFGDFDGQLEVDVPPELKSRQQAAERQEQRKQQEGLPQKGAKGPTPAKGLQRRGTHAKAPLKASKRQSILRPMLWMVALAAGLAVAYLGYCRYDVYQKRVQFSRLAQDLHDELIRLDREVGPQEVRGVVLELAEAVGVAVDPEQVEVSSEPLNATTATKLSESAREGLEVVTQDKEGRAPRFVIGFKARLTARSGIFEEAFSIERYTWFDRVSSDW